MTTRKPDPNAYLFGGGRLKWFFTDVWRALGHFRKTRSVERTRNFWRGCCKGRRLMREGKL